MDAFLEPSVSVEIIKSEKNKFYIKLLEIIYKTKQVFMTNSQQLGTKNTSSATMWIVRKSKLSFGLYLFSAALILPVTISVSPGLSYSSW